ncbi:MAG: RNA polymerase sigma factor, partial [Aggregatilineales bacterium]
MNPLYDFSELPGREGDVMVNSIERELLKQAQSGDMQAFEQLRNRHENRLRRFIQRLIGATGQEDDVLQ